MGFFKGENGERMHVFSLANQNASGVRVRIWLERIVAILQKEKKRGCPAFCDEEGYILLSENVEEIMHPILEALRGSAGLEQMSSMLKYFIDVTDHSLEMPITPL